MLKVLSSAILFLCGYSYMVVTMCGHEGVTKDGTVVPMSACRRSFLAPINWMLRSIFCMFGGVWWIEEHYHDDSPYAIHCCFCCIDREELMGSRRVAGHTPQRVDSSGQPSDPELAEGRDSMVDLINTGRAGPPAGYGCGSLLWAIGARYTCCCLCPYLRSPDCPKVVAIGGHSSETNMKLRLMSLPWIP